MSSDKIIIKGAKENNLQNIDLEIPKEKLVVMTGVSGSGKSSLAFDTIFAEGQRRFVESLSAYARQFLGNSEKPNVDSIEGLSPAISIDQKSTNHNPRSTVGTVTEIYDYLRLVYAKIGTPYCINHDIPISAWSQEEMVNKILELEEGSRVYILSPVVVSEKGTQKAVFEKYIKEGFVRAIVDGQMIELEEAEELEKNTKHSVDIVVERIKMRPNIRSRIAEAVSLACEASKGYCKVFVDSEEKFFFSEHYACKFCGYSIPKLEPRLFSFNNPLGACPDCHGLGYKLTMSERLVLNEDLSLEQGAIIPYKNANEENLWMQELKGVCDHYNISFVKPFKSLSKKNREIVLYGSSDILEIPTVSTSGVKRVTNRRFPGVMTYLQERYEQTSSSWIREWLEQYMIDEECQTCHGKRLNEEVLHVRIADKNIIEVTDMTIKDALNFFNNLVLDKTKQEIAKLALKEIKDRLQFLLDVGLEYLTLSRSATTLSGGEAQRIRLATQIGSQLSGVLYVLDEPSIGLHQRDNDRLIASLKKMRDIGNTLIVVEHDSDTMLQSDYLVDIGPGAGIHGGKVMACGTPQEVMDNPNSLTGKYLKHELFIPLPKQRRKGNGKFIELKGAEVNNLKNVNLKIPLGTLTLVTGVSGSGKSSLINEALYKNIYVKLHKASKIKPGKIKSIKGLENIEKVIRISQEPIGKTPRSNPATYTKVFDDIRDLFAKTKEAKIRGFKKGHFSFNVKGGRCEACKGDGVKKISMHFLPDVYVKCEVCGGTRYQSETLEVKYKGKNISDVLNMTIEDALEFFSAVPKIKSKIQTLNDVGLGYMTLGQSSTTLSGGEAQRVKLANELNSRITDKTLYIMDEPTTGLHIHDIKKLMEVIEKIVDSGATVVIIEHNLDVIKLADNIVDLGPDGGDGGGEIIFTGTPEDLIKDNRSYTAKYLKEYL